MIKTAIVYYSKHHGNTKKLLDAIAAEHEVTLIDVTAQPPADLTGYDRIGFASGIYYSSFAKQILAYAGEHLPEGKDVFYLYTHGAPKGDFLKARAMILSDRSNWLAALPKGIPQKTKSKQLWIFTGSCKEGTEERSFRPPELYVQNESARTDPDGTEG